MFLVSWNAFAHFMAGRALRPLGTLEQTPPFKNRFCELLAGSSVWYDTEASRPIIGEEAMSIVITDKTLLEQFGQALDTVEIRDGNGRLLGMFAPPYGKLPAGVRSPFTEEEIERRRSEPDGQLLADIMRELEKRA
jgi:hypothetical protein